MGIRSRVVAGIVAGLVLGITGSAAAGAAPVRFPVDVVVHTEIGGGPNDFEGNIPGCETGTVLDVDPRATFTPWGGVFKGDKEFTCDSGEAGFVIKLTAQFGEGGAQGRWTLQSAWGDLEGLKGAGSLVGIPTEVGIDDVYTGYFR